MAGREPAKPTGGIQRWVSNRLGHSYGLAATLVRGTEGITDVAAGVIGDDKRRYVLLTSDVGYGRPSFEQQLHPSVVVDTQAAFHSLDWVRAAGED